MTWEEMQSKRQAPSPKSVFACDCMRTLLAITPTAEGLCPYCGYYPWLEPEWNVAASITKRKGRNVKMVPDTVETRGRKYNKEKAQKVLTLRAQGLTISAIGKELGLGVSSVHKYIHDKRNT